MELGRRRCLVVCLQSRHTARTAQSRLELGGPQFDGVPLRLVFSLGHQATRAFTLGMRATGARGTAAFFADGAPPEEDSHETRYFRKQVRHWYSPLTGHMVSGCIVRHQSSPMAEQIESNRRLIYFNTPHVLLRRRIRSTAALAVPMDNEMPVCRSQLQGLVLVRLGWFH